MNEKSVNKCQSSQYTNFESNLNDWHLLIDKVSNSVSQQILTAVTS